MKMKLTMCFMVMLALGMSSAFGADLFTESFETPVAPEDPGFMPFNEESQASAPDETWWSEEGSGGGIMAQETGWFTTPYGNQCAWSNTNVHITLTDVLEANTTYTLSANVAIRTDDVGGDFLVELLAGDTVLGSETGTPTTTDFSESVEVVIPIGATHVALGEALTIRLGINEELQPLFDNVVLSSEFVPPAPVITPSSPYAIAGKYFALTAPTGEGYVDYQWSDKNGDIADDERISGAVTDELAFEPLEETDAGTYTVTYDDGTGAKEVVEVSIEIDVIPAGNEVPLTGLLGLGLLAGACVLGGSSVLRRKK